MCTYLSEESRVLHVEDADSAHVHISVMYAHVSN